MLTNALSHIYSNDILGNMVHAASEYMMFADNNALLNTLEYHAISVPVLVDLEGHAATELVTAAAKPERHPQQL